MAIFRDEKDFRSFLKRLEEAIERFSLEVHAWVLLPNHFHLLLQTQEANLSRAMHWLLTSHTMDFKRRHHFVGHLFQGRYKSYMVEEQGYFAELGRYIHLNAVRGRRLGEGDLPQRRRRLREYRWSSYRHYAGLDRKQMFPVREDVTFAELGIEAKSDKRAQYRRFVERGLVDELEDPLEQARGLLILGKESFVQKMRDRMRQRAEGQAAGGVAARRELREKERGEVILQEAAEAAGMAVEDFRRRRKRGDRASTAAMVRLQREAGWTLPEIGSRMGGMTAEAVAQRISRFKRAQEEK